MIKTITLLGAGKSNSALALAFALKAPDGYLVEVFDTNQHATHELRSKLKQLGLKSPAIWFSKNAANATWGADVIVLDLPSRNIMPMLRDIKGAPNDKALITSISDVAPKTSEVMLAFIKTAGLTYLNYNAKKIQSVWKKAGIHTYLPPEEQLALNFDQ